MSLPGHFWTVWPALRHRLKPWAAPPSTPWAATVEDPKVGDVRLSGRLTREDPRRLLVLVHGLGGCHDSPYLNRACTVASEAHGLSTFRFEMRGSDRGGADLYHAGLSADLGVALSSPELRNFEDLYLLGFSLGGHLALHYAAHAPDPRLRAVAAVSSPLHLEATVERFDEPGRVIYQRHVLRALKDLYRAVDARREMPVPLERVLRIRKLREWDALTVVPRFDFGDTATYYREASVGPKLGQLRHPALLVAGEGDPMVTADAIRRGLALTRHDLRVEWIPGAGHVGFPATVDFGEKAPRGLDHQILAWLLSH
ncbi:MAG: alpha/beta fold hydrolase [Acidobacteriota bacterium]